MRILTNLEVPTGNILVVEGEKGKLEMLSIGDYGKDVNLKCNAMGLTREPEPVMHVPMLPLEKKWVITISTQYGCSMGCKFCDVPKVGPGINATLPDLIEQVVSGLELHPEVKRTERLNIHYARMGEPTFNENVINATYFLSGYLRHTMHPVVSTMMPRNNKRLKDFIMKWMKVKNDLMDGEAGLQLSINTTCEATRRNMFSGNALDLANIAIVMGGIVPKGRKITLNFAVADGWPIDPEVLLRYFSPEHYIIKLTPMHKTEKAIDKGIWTIGDYTEYAPYQEHEEALIKAGYDVLVFIASEYEDMGRITCGNAILSGTLPEVPYQECCTECGKAGVDLSKDERLCIYCYDGNPRPLED